MMKDRKFGTDIRLALDIGCGAGSLAAALEAQGVLTLSIAAPDSADNGVQLVVERGYPALVQSLGTQRLPYPSQAFDLIHCAARDVQREAKGNFQCLHLLKITVKLNHKSSESPKGSTHSIGKDNEPHS